MRCVNTFADLFYGDLLFVPGMLRRKENNSADAQAGTAARTGRQLLSTAAPPDEEEPTIFAGMVDVDALINKMEGEVKMDYKGNSEKMMEFIKKLRTCIKWLLETENKHLSEIFTSQFEEKQNSETVVKWINTLNEARVVNVGIQEQHASLQKILKKVEGEKMDALWDLEDEKEASVESSRNLLLEDLRRIKLERKCLNEQVKMLQNTNKRIQKYETSLLQYLQADATKNSETIAKLQKEKNTIVETMNTLKDHLQMQLDLEKSLQSEATKQINDLLKEL